MSASQSIRSVDSHAGVRRAILAAHRIRINGGDGACRAMDGALMLLIIARNFLFHPFDLLPAEGPGLDGVRGEVGEVQGHHGQESPDSAECVNDFQREVGFFS